MNRLPYFIVVVAAIAVAAAEPAKRAADPAATKLLADARAARVLYHDFPGFSADVQINLNGKVTRGQVEVSDKGKVVLQLDDAPLTLPSPPKGGEGAKKTPSPPKGSEGAKKTPSPPLGGEGRVRGEAEKWAKNTLASIIAHRLDSGPSDGDTPCAFVDKDEHHPLGRAIRVLNDEFHSSYRIRDRQVIVVNRHVPGSRFTITVMENLRTKEDKFLPACFVVNTWDAKTDALTSSETHHQTWQRVGAFDLPKETLAVKAVAGKLESRCLKLSNVHLK